MIKTEGLSLISLEAPVPHHVSLILFIAVRGFINTVGVYDSYHPQNTALNGLHMHIHIHPQIMVDYIFYHCTGNF